MTDKNADHVTNKYKVPLSAGISRQTRESGVKLKSASKPKTQMCTNEANIRVFLKEKLSEYFHQL